METKIVEDFLSIQGEGPRNGEPSYFIRTAGCTLHCPFCDTKYALSKNLGEKFGPELLERIVDSKVSNVVLTGGEPTIHLKNDKFVDFIINLITVHNFGITFETTTLMELDFLKESDIITVLSYFDNFFIETETEKIDYVVSPKLDLECYPSAIDATIEDIIKYYSLMNFESLYDLTGALSYKFIYDKGTEENLLRMLEVIPEWFKLNYTYIMPFTEINHLENYKKSCEDTINFCIKNNVRYSPRIHIDIWGNKKGV